MKECKINVYLNEVYSSRQNLTCWEKSVFEIFKLKSELYGLFIDSKYIGCETFILSGMKSCPVTLNSHQSFVVNFIS